MAIIKIIEARDIHGALGQIEEPEKIERIERRPFGRWLVRLEEVM